MSAVSSRKRTNGVEYVDVQVPNDDVAVLVATRKKLSVRREANALDGRVVGLEIADQLDVFLLHK